MTTVTIQLAAETTDKLRQRALRQGKSLEDYIRDLAEAHVHAVGSARSAALSVAELDSTLDELAAGLPALPRLPQDFSRAEIYGEHD